MSGAHRCPLLLLAMLLLAACAAPGTRPPPDDAAQARADRELALAGWESWGLTGRLGVDDGQDGGSGRIDWQDQGDLSELRFRGALGQGAWRLQVEPGKARLALADGRVVEAPDVDQLVLRETGLRLPVNALSWWVRGLPWPGAPRAPETELNEDGTLRGLKQLGWEISYSRYTEHRGEQLPSRLEARREEVQVKLAVSRWLGGTAGDQ